MLCWLPEGTTGASFVIMERGSFLQTAEGTDHQHHSRPNIRPSSQHNSNSAYRAMLNVTEAVNVAPFKM